MAITNNLNVWDKNGVSNYDNSTTLSGDSECQNGFSSGSYLKSAQFNGILKEMSLVTKSLIDAVKSYGTGTVDNTLNNSTLASMINTAFVNLINEKIDSKNIERQFYLHTITFSESTYQYQLSFVNKTANAYSNYEYLWSALTGSNFYFGARIRIAEPESQIRFPIAIEQTSSLPDGIRIYYMRTNNNTIASVNLNTESAWNDIVIPY